MLSRSCDITNASHTSQVGLSLPVPDAYHDRIVHPTVITLKHPSVNPSYVFGGRVVHDDALGMVSNWHKRRRGIKQKDKRWLKKSRKRRGKRGQREEEYFKIIY